eukprot:SAG31_NODE_22164_length_532_cov_1.011547_1_plen_106_part_00
MNSLEDHELHETLARRHHHSVPRGVQFASQGQLVFLDFYVHIVLRIVRLHCVSVGDMSMHATGEIGPVVRIARALAPRDLAAVSIIGLSTLWNFGTSRSGKVDPD